ncbi:MAG TPA: hypothetical protein VLA19_00165, partial [Herpetosiphonaceae bacterium]|nr:hypothetical protein [Herpetosiphonaceae bacterium]
MQYPFFVPDGRTIRPGLLYAKFVTLGVLHHDPVFSALLHWVELRRAEPDQALHLGIDTPLPFVQQYGMAAAHIQIEMHTILDVLRFRDALEVDTRPAAIGIANRVRCVPLVFRHA